MVPKGLLHLGLKYLPLSEKCDATLKIVESLHTNYDIKSKGSLFRRLP